MQDSRRAVGAALQEQVPAGPSRDELRRLVSYAVMAPFANYRNVRFLARAGVAQAFEQIGADAVRKSSAIGLLTVPGTSRQDYFRGGRALEALWLTASALELGFQPVAVAPYPFARLLRGTGFCGEQASALRTERARLAAVFRLRDEHAELMMFRLSDVPPPSARALRRSLDAVLRFS